MSKLYRSANGKLVDLDQLMLRGEDTIAVGNMKVNARGDELGPGGKVVKTRNQRVSESYKLHSMIPSDDIVHADAASASTKAQLTQEPKPVPVSELRQPIPEKKEPTTKRQRGGLAASIAKARVIGDAEESTSTTVKRIQNGGE